MIGVDTNILVRYIAGDDAKQSRLAAEFIGTLTFENPGFVSLVCIAELYWVLDHTFKASRDEIVTIIQMLLTSEEILIENTALVHAALNLYNTTNADFDDCIIALRSRSAGCDFTVTFDRKAAKALGMTLLY